MYSVPGFVGAPVSKAFLLLVSITTLITTMLKFSPVTPVQLDVAQFPDKLLYFLIPFCTYPIGGILLVAGPLVYIGRITERLLGSRRFFGLFLLSNVCSFLLQYFLSHYLPTISHSHSIFIPKPDTPFFITSGVFVSTLIPLFTVSALNTTYVLKYIPVNEKLFLIILILQLVLVFPPFSVVSFVVALFLAPLVLYLGFFRVILDLIVPKFIARLASKLLLPFLLSRSPPSVSMSRSLATSFPRGIPSQPPIPHTPFEPAQTMVDLLVEMGFGEEESKRALRITSGNIEGAIGHLTQSA
ncbi:hypothetical protein GEMRC1_007041 [Eukaryota sp. GEM-RC1]